MGYYEEEPEYYTADVVPNRIGLGSQITDFIKNGKLNITTGDVRIKESIRDILSTRIGTRFMFPYYGCRIHDLLFEQNTEIVHDLAKEYVREAIDKWEPRVEVLSVTAEGDERILSVEMLYKVKDLGTVDSFVYTLERKLAPVY